MKIAYFDCSAGAGGDMIVAAMVDAGVDAGFLDSQLETLGVDGFGIEFGETSRAGLRAVSFRILAPEQHHHRKLKQITGIIRESKITEAAKETALAIFDKLAQAEAAVHGKEAGEITFHEVGALDSIGDIVCASVGMDWLRRMGVERVYCSALSVGGGSVKGAHGLLPVPAPATAELLKGIAIAGGPVDAELLTPTAAAILVSVVDQFAPLPPMKIETVGYGAGSQDFSEFSNVLRLILGEMTEERIAEADTVCVLETNVDDISGEVVGSALEKLLGCGALDVFTTPIYMKQNRPAVQISVICRLEDAAEMERRLFEEGLTFGIRRQTMQRSRLAREFVTVSTEFGEIRIKVGSLGERVVNAKPEYSDCMRAAKEHKVPLKVVLGAAVKAYENSGSARK